jgi:hypothetical protein
MLGQTSAYGLILHNGGHQLIRFCFQMFRNPGRRGLFILSYKGFPFPDVAAGQRFFLSSNPCDDIKRR